MPLTGSQSALVWALECWFPGCANQVRHGYLACWKHSELPLQAPLSASSRRIDVALRELWQERYCHYLTVVDRAADGEAYLCRMMGRSADMLAFYRRRLAEREAA